MYGRFRSLIIFQHVADCLWTPHALLTSEVCQISAPQKVFGTPHPAEIGIECDLSDQRSDVHTQWTENRTFDCMYRVQILITDVECANPNNSCIHNLLPFRSQECIVRPYEAPCCRYMKQQCRSFGSSEDLRALSIVYIYRCIHFVFKYDLAQFALNSMIIVDKCMTAI